MIDLTTDFGKRVEQRLKVEQVIWLTSVGLDGTPQPNPVWFLWDHGEILVYTQPASYIPHAHRHPAYFEKYRQGIADISMTPEAFAKDYSVPLRITPMRLRGF
jgi:hypothetical protein